MRIRVMASLVVLQLAVGAVAGCAARAHRPWWSPEDQSHLKEPFSLKVNVDRSDVAIGESLTIEYILANTSDVAVTACANGWGDFHLSGTRRGVGHATTSVDGVLPEAIFRLPPHTRMVWSAVIKVPDVGAGSASLRGTLRSSCSLWPGEVWSEPVAMTLRSQQTIW